MAERKTSDAKPLKPVYYLCGVEDCLIEEKVNAIKAAALTGAFASMNYQVFEGKGLSAEEVVAAASTMPAFSDYRVILVKNMGAKKEKEEDVLKNAATVLKKEKEEEALLKYVQNPSPSTCLIFTSDVKKPDMKSPLVKYLDEKGVVKVFYRLDENELIDRTQKEVKALGKTISTGAARRLVEIAGSRLRDVKGEIEKAFLYAGDKPSIDISDVEDACLDCREETIYGISEAIGAKDAKAAFKVYAKVSSEEPYVIVGAIARQLRILLKTKALIRKGVDPRDLPSALGVNPRFIDGYRRGSANFTERELRGAIERLHRADVSLKTGKAPLSVVIHRFILESCRRGAA